MAAGAAPIERAAERVARLMTLTNSTLDPNEPRRRGRDEVFIAPDFDDPVAEFDDDESPPDPPGFRS
jgi:hypothetical protein